MAATTTLPSTERLLELVRRFAGQHVLVLADMVADRFITGTPKRISREAPVLILRHESEVLTPGGGANAVANVAALGGVPLPIGIVGDDASGHALVEALAERGARTDGILFRSGFRTPTKTRILGGGRHAIKQQIVRFDVEDHLEITPEEREQIASLLRSWHGLARTAVLSDYGYGSVEPGLLDDVRRCLGPSGVVLCDSRYRLADFHGLDGATPNEEEAETLAGHALGENRDALVRSGAELRAKLGGRFLLVTRGSRGMALFDGAGLAEIPVHGTDQVADVTGAGDTVIGTFALALAAGASPLEAALLANYAGGVVVMKMGTATLTPGELVAALQSDPRPLAETRWAAS